MDETLRRLDRVSGVALAVDGGDDLTYGEWAQRSDAVARGLVGRGVAPGEPIGLLFDAPRWADFAVARLGVRKAGAVAVLLSPGAARSDLAPVTGLLCPPDLVPPGVSVWTAHPDEVGRGHDAGPVVDQVLGGAGVPALAGSLVHVWAPGSPAGEQVVSTLLAAPHASSAATLAVFDPERLCALVGRRRAGSLGLTPALAAALLASGALGRHDLSHVRHLLLSGPPSSALRSRLEAAFPGAAWTELDDNPPAVLAGSAPVAVSQEGMLWHEQFAPGSFNLPCLVRRYEGPLDVAALEWALSELMRRHQPLRSTFALAGGEARQLVHEGVPPLATVDLSAVRPEKRDDEVARIVADATGRPFDLATGPLFEPRLVRLGADDHLLVVRLHHTVFDDWSVDLFRRELSALYGARLAGAPSPLVEPPTSFADFCRRQRARLDGPAGAEERSWWRRELEGAPLAVQLPVGPGSRQPGEPLRVDLSPSLVALVRALAPQLRATPYMTVLAAFSVLLARTTGQDDLLIATVVAHRNRSDVEPLVGCFTKKVPLRLRVDADPTFAELVARTRSSLLGSLSHQGLGFETALQAGLGRAAADHGVVPQVAVVFQGETPQQVKLALPGLVTGPYEVGEGARAERHFSAGTEQAWGDGMYLGTFLILSLLETTDGMVLVARGVFDRAAVRDLLGDLLELLAVVVADPSQPVTGRRPGESEDDDVLDLRGLRTRRSRLEAALARCPGVADVTVTVRVVDGEPRLIASVVHEGDHPPTLTRLRRALWSELPGAMWPAAMEVDGRLVPAEPDPDAELLAAMWGELAGRAVGPGTSYWQDFSFLPALAEARAAGLVPDDEYVVRCRTPEMLAAVRAGR